MNLREIAEKLGLEFRGDPEKKISQIRDLGRLTSSESIVRDAIYYVENQRILKRYLFLEKKKESISVLTLESLAGHFINTLIASENSIKLSFIQLLTLFSKEPDFTFEKNIIDRSKSFIHELAKVSPSAIIMPQAVVMQGAEIADEAIIYPHVTIGPGAKIGKQTLLHPGVVIGYNCIVGNHCIIYGGSVIGADGFGYHDYQGKRYKVPQVSHVEIHDYVEIGANSCIDRGTIEPTIIGAHTKIDNQVQIGHNCVVGEHVIMAGNVGVSGSVTIGNQAILAGKTGVSEHVHIAEEAVIMGASVLLSDAKPKTAYFGYPARISIEAHRIDKATARLPELLKRVKILEKKVYGQNDGN